MGVCGLNDGRSGEAAGRWKRRFLNRAVAGCRDARCQARASVAVKAGRSWTSQSHSVRPQRSFGQPQMRYGQTEEKALNSECSFAMSLAWTLRSTSQKGNTRFLRLREKNNCMSVCGLNDGRSGKAAGRWKRRFLNRAVAGCRDARCQARASVAVKAGHSWTSQSHSVRPLRSFGQPQMRYGQTQEKALYSACSFAMSLA